MKFGAVPGCCAVAPTAARLIATQILIAALTLFHIQILRTRMTGRCRRRVNSRADYTRCGASAHRASCQDVHEKFDCGCDEFRWLKKWGSKNLTLSVKQRLAGWGTLTRCLGCEVFLERVQLLNG
jgi:hypothetical protein